MNLEYKYLLPGSFSKESRVWIYQASRLLSLSEALEAEELINKFCAEWRSHGADVDAYGNLFFGQFLVLMADETRAGVSGCSTDSSVRMIKEIEKLFNTNMFDRMSLAFVRDGKIQMLPLQQLNYAITNGFITGETIYLNNLVQTKRELLQNWMVPVKNSWLASRLKPVSA